MLYNKHNFQIASLSPGDQRYYLDGIFVTPDYTEVTNGHYLVRVTRPEGLKVEDLPVIPDHKVKRFTKKERDEKEDHFILPAAAAKEIEKAIPGKNGTMPILSNAWITNKTKGDQVEFITTDLETARPFLARKVEGKWPKTEAIWPTEDPGLTIGFNPDYMIKICQQFKKMDIRFVKLDLYGLTKSMQLSGKNLDKGQEIKAVLMPCKIDGEKDFEKQEETEEIKDPKVEEVQEPTEDQQQPEDPEPEEVPEEEIEIEESIKEEKEPALAAVQENKKKKGIEIKFTRKPEKSILEDLKKNGWRWSRYFKVWYNRNTPENLAYAISL